MHRLVTPIPDSCILKPDDPEMLRPLIPVVKSKRGGRGAVGKKQMPMLVDIIQSQSVSMQIKESPNVYSNILFHTLFNFIRFYFQKGYYFTIDYYINLVIYLV